MSQNVTIKRYSTSSASWVDIYPKTTWSQIENKPTSFTPASHNHDSTYLKKAGGTMTGAIILTEQSSVWNDNNIKGNVQGSSIGFNTNGKVGIRAKVTTGNEEDAIDFRVNSNTRLQLGDSKLYPSTTNQYSLGSSDKQFNNIYGKTIYENGTSLANKYYEMGKNLTISDGTKYLNMRSGHDNYDGGMYYSTPGNEALVFAVKNSVTSFIFKGGLSCTSGTSWGSVTPDLQIKNGKVAINKLIPNDTQGSYNLDVNGTSNATTMYENNVALANKYQQGYTGFDLSDANKIGYVETYDGRSFEKTGSTDWNASAYSSYCYKNCRLVFKPNQNNKYLLVGLNSQIEDNDWQNVDYAFLLTDGGYVYIEESGAEQGNFGQYNAGDEFVIEYSNSYVRYYRNGELKKTTLRLLGDPLYFDAKLYSYGAKIYGVSFEPMLMGYISTTGGTITGRPNIYNPSSDTVLNLKSGSTGGCFMEFQTSSGSTAGYLGVSSTHLPLIDATNAGGGLKVLMTNADFSVSGTTLTITIPSNP